MALETTSAPTFVVLQTWGNVVTSHLLFILFLLVHAVPALITTGGYGKARKKRAASNENERIG